VIPDAEVVVSVRGVRVQYAGVPRVVALDGVDFDVAAGERLVITGPSGAGKSTLLHVLSGMVAPTEGTVEILGVNTRSLGDAGLARLRLTGLGFVFQRFHLLPHLTAEENVALPARLAGRSRSQALERAREVLDLVGLADRAVSTPDRLSGGEMQRVAVARAVVGSPRVVFADEPTGNLDTAAGARVLEVLAAATVHAGSALVIVTHDQQVLDAGGRPVRLLDGRVVTTDMAPTRG
jgi:putative ABC transport system ATP-binding protein